MDRGVIAGSLLIIALAIQGCGSAENPEIAVNIKNPDGQFTSGDLSIEICAPMELNLPELNVHVYVTENEDWRMEPDALAYTEYFNRDFVSIPGTISESIGDEFWHPSGNSCLTAELEGAFLRTEEWLQRGVCPFRAVVVVLNYSWGSWNAADITECTVGH